MEQEIFERKLSVEATSAYILLCSLKEKGEILSRDTISPYWQGTDEQLTLALQELKENGIVELRMGDNILQYEIKKQCDWKK